MIHATCYVLRKRAYSETSLLLELLTNESQYVHALYRGAKRRGATPIDLLTEYAMSWRPKVGLLTVRSCEPLGAIRLSGQALYAGLYLNELIRRGLRENQVVEGVHPAYQTALQDLETKKNTDLEVVLRKFEKAYLKALGYEIVFHHELSSGRTILADSFYRFEPTEGFCPTDASDELCYNGDVILAISADEYSSTETRQAAKLILRDALRHHLGDRSLKAPSLLTAKQFREAATESGSYG